MTGIYAQKDACWSWAAGTEGSPAAEASYPVFDDWTLDPEIRDTISNFDAGSIYRIMTQIVGKRMAGAIRVPMFQQADIANTPPVWAKFLRMAGMSESDTGDTFVYAAASPKFSTDDVAGSCYPGSVKLNIDNHLLPVFTNAVAEVAFELVAPGVPTLAVNLIGQRPTGFPVDTAQVAVTHPLQPIPIGGMSITMQRVGDNITGTATSTGTTTLTDSAATFLSSGVQPGDVITNTTDGSTGGGVVTGITSETVLTHTALTGGSGNDWQISDAYTIAEGAAPVERCTRLMLPLGNVLAEQPGVGGTNAYYQPRIVERTNAIYTMDLDMPVRSDFDWIRCMEVMSLKNPTTHYFAFTVVHNSGGAAGSVLTWTFHARPIAISKSRGNAGQMMLSTQWQQRYDGGLLSLIVS